MVQPTTSSTKANGINFCFLEMGAGPLVLCMHGFPDNAHSFRYLLPVLAGAGFRAVAPFMRGYAPTGAPADGRYQSATLSQDVLALVDALGAEQAVVIGHDWGARAVYGAAVLDPHKVSKLVTLASSHPAAGDRTSFQHLKGAWHAFYFQLPQAESTVSHNDYAFIGDWWKDSSPQWDIPADDLARVKETFRTPGVLEAALGYYRHSYNAALQDPALKEVQQKVNTAPIPVETLAFHGTKDRPGRLEAFQDMDHLFTNGLEKVIIPGTGHFIHREKPDEVNGRIVQFIMD